MTSPLWKLLPDTSPLPDEQSMDASLTQRELVPRLYWFIHVRWGAVAGVLLTIAVAHWLFRVALPWGRLVGYAGCVAVYNLLFLEYAVNRDRAGQEWTPWQAYRFANVQILLDLLFLALMLHAAGGIQNPFAFFFIFHVVTAGILLPPRSARFHAITAVVLLGGLAALEGWHVVPHVSLAGALPSEFYDTPYALGVVAAFAMTVAFACEMTISIMVRLRDRDRAIRQLSREVEEHAEQLQEAYDHLRETQELQVNYMRKVSHELRSPLAAVQSLLQVVTTGLAGELPQKADDLLERAEIRVKELLRMVNDLLVLLRARNVQLEARLESVNLRHAVERVVDLLQSRADQEGVRLDTRLPDDLVTLDGDAEAIEQLLTNLTANAIKYTSEGGSVVISLSADAERATIRVSDTGIGIEPDELPHIFDEFYRARSAREYQAVGTGLGLSIVRSCVQLHDGEIDVTSSPGHGSTFTVRLPLHRRTAKDDDDARKPGGGRHGMAGSE